MSNLNTQCKSFNVVFNIPFRFKVIDDFNLCLDKLNDTLSRNSMFYASIKHDNDFNNNGEKKLVHFHYVITCATRKRVSTMLYFLADALGYDVNNIDLINTIQIEKCDSVPLSIQYLIHKNNTDKTQYDIKDIVTNYKDNDINDFMTFENQEITTRYLYDLVKNGFTDVEIMFIIGVGRYHLFKGAISDIRYAIARNGNELEKFINSL